MNKISIVVIILVLVILAGGIYYFSASKKAPVVRATNNLPAANNTPTPEISPALPTASTTEPTAQVTEVVIKKLAFEPAQVQVKIGEEVKWTNQDSENHTVMGDGFGSQQLTKGQSFSRAFGEAGSFNYHCSLHPSMTGKIIVSP
ncbi:MAG: cupredoxin domain-containing protein [bacterium]